MYFFDSLVIPKRNNKMTHVALNFYDALNNRELAIAIWLIIAITWGVSNSKIRESLFQIVKAFFAWKLTVLYLFMFAYITVLIYVMSILGLWRMDHISITVLWGVFVAFVMVSDFMKANDSNFFKNALMDNLKALIILEFIINLYVFPLWVELIFVPFSALLGGSIAISETKKEYEIVKKILIFIMGLIGFIFICYAVYMIITEFKQFATFENFESFYLPIIFSIMFIPFVYLFALYSGYEMFFIRLCFFVDDLQVLRYAKKKTVFAFNLNLWKLNGWSKYVVSEWRFKEKQEVDDAILVFKNAMSSSKI